MTLMATDNERDLLAKLNAAVCAIRDAEKREHEARRDREQALRCYGFAMAELENRAKEREGQRGAGM